jgi:hypothetical protein
LNTRDFVTERQRGKFDETSQVRRLHIWAMKSHQEILDLDDELATATDIKHRTQLVERIYFLRDLEESIRRKLR